MASSSCYIFIIIIIHSFIVSLSFCVFLHACKFECFEINNIKHCIFCYSNICWNRIILTPHTHAYVEIYVVWFYVVVCELAGFCMLLSRFWLFFFILWLPLLLQLLLFYSSLSFCCCYCCCCWWWWRKMNAFANFLWILFIVVCACHAIRLAIVLASGFLFSSKGCIQRSR